MVKAKRHSTPKQSTRNRPSIFFLIVLLIALTLFAWGAIKLIRTPMHPTGTTHSKTK